MNVYDPNFYSALSSPARESARRILPIVLALVRPRRVIDVGCGTAAWLAVVRQLSDAAVVGVDGASVPREILEIPLAQFMTRDLGQPLVTDERFDLAISLEVAEHLPAERAIGFVRDLTSLAPAVLFSAAIPNQGGVGHTNEQWQSYWIDVFRQQGFEAWDVVRPSVWNADDVAWFYRQNMFLFVNPEVHAGGAAHSVALADVVHPELFRLASDPPVVSLPQALRQLAAAARRAVNHRLGNRRTYFSRNLYPTSSTGRSGPT